MEALTDTSLQPDAPERVPSGLPVVEVTTRESPPPALIAARRPIRAGPGQARKSGCAPGASERVRVIETHEVIGRASPAGRREAAEGSVPGATFHVRPGQSIQRAVDRAHPGDRIEIAPGVYEEAVIVEIENLTLAGGRGTPGRCWTGAGGCGAGITVRRRAQAGGPRVSGLSGGGADHRRTRKCLISKTCTSNRWKRSGAKPGGSSATRAETGPLKETTNRIRGGRETAQMPV
jgi:hypothetical protein